MFWRSFLLVAFGLFVSVTAAEAQCSSYTNISNGSTADATVVMHNFGCAALTSGATLNAVTLTGTTSFPGSGIITSTGNVGIGTTNPNLPDTNNSLFLTMNGVSAGSELALGGNPGLGANVGDLDFYNPAISASEKRIALVSAQIDPSQSNSGALLFYTANNGTLSEALTIAKNGNIGIGTYSPSYPLTVNGTAYATGAAGALSDVRHKKDIEPLQDGALERIMRLRPVSFFWKTPKDDGMKGRQMGFIAQEVEKVLPTTVLTENNAEKTKGLKYNEITAVLTKAVQEQEIEIRDLRMANDNRMSEVSQLQTELGVLKRQLKVQAAQN